MISKDLLESPEPLSPACRVPIKECRPGLATKARAASTVPHGPSIPVGSKVLSAPSQHSVRTIEKTDSRASKRRLGATVLVCLLALLLGGVALAERVRDLKPTGYVNDFAGVLSPETRNQLEALCTEVDRQAHAQIAVITVHTTGDDSIDDFAVRLEEKWKVGAKGSDRGLLLLIATDDHKYRFEVGYGLEGILPDGKVGTIGREMVPYLRQGDYDAAVTLGVRDVSQVIAQDAGITLQTQVQNYVPERKPQPFRGVRDILFAVFVIFAFISLMRSGSSGWAGFLLGTILGNILGGGGGRDGGFGGGGGGDGGGFGGFGGGSSGGGGASGSW